MILLGYECVYLTYPHQRTDEYKCRNVIYNPFLHASMTESDDSRTEITEIHEIVNRNAMIRTTKELKRMYQYVYVLKIGDRTQSRRGNAKFRMVMNVHVRGVMLGYDAGM